MGATSTPRVRDAAATQRRILTAAIAEFAAHGLAGARVDRLAAAADVNKAQLYHYFGNKEALFDAAFAEQVKSNTDGIPLDATDLPAYAVALHDGYLEDPVLMRLVTWARLERTPTGDLFSRRGGIEQWAFDRLAAGQADGFLVEDIDPADMFCLLIALAGTWAQASITIAGATDDPQNPRRREALATTVRRAFCRPARGAV